MRKMYIMVLFVLVASCDKTTITHPVQPHLEQYFSFKQGTYWIYRDYFSNNQDSFAVIGNSKSTSKIAKNEFTEKISIDINEYHNGLLNDTMNFNITIDTSMLTLYCLNKNGYNVTQWFGIGYHYPILNAYDGFDLELDRGFNLLTIQRTDSNNTIIKWMLQQYNIVR